MDHEQRTKAANEQDPKQAGRIVRSLKQIEDDYHLASVTLSEKLMLAVVQAIKKAVPEPFRVVENEPTCSIVVPEWRATRGVGQDAAIELSEISREGDDQEYCWLTAATAVGPTRLGLELVFRPGLREAALKIIGDEKQMAAVWKAGILVRDETDLRLFIPIILPKLAEAFEQNDLNVAMAPVTKAVEQVVAAMPELTKIVEAVRVAAKVTK